MEREEVSAFGCYLEGLFQTRCLENSCKSEILEQKLEDAPEKAIKKLKKNILVVVNRIFKVLKVELAQCPQETE